MKPISTDLENIFQPVQLREDEYLNGETNLIYCSRCRTPRQKRFEMTGKLFEPRCMCACQQLINSGSRNESTGSFWTRWQGIAAWDCLTRNCGSTPLKMILDTTPNK